MNTKVWMGRLRVREVPLFSQRDLANVFSSMAGGHVQVVRAFLGLVLVLFYAPAAPQVRELHPQESATLSGADEATGAFGDFFGSHVAHWREWLFVGAPHERDVACQHRDGGFCDGEDDGAVYIFQRHDQHGYRLVQRLAPREVGLSPEADGFPGAGDRFGAGVAAAGGQLLVGVANFPADVADGSGFRWFAGAVEIFALNSRTDRWEWTGQTLRSPEPRTDGSFGARTNSTHVALDDAGRLVLIGESMNGISDVPRFHVFRRVGGESWQLIQTILAPDDSRGTVIDFGEKIISLDEGYYVVPSKVIVSDDGVNISAIISRLDLYGPGRSPGLSSTPLETLEQTRPFLSFFEGFGDNGMAYAKGRLLIADPLAEVDGILAAGAIHVYRFRPDARPRLTLESMVPHPEPVDYGFGFGDFLGANWGSGRQSVAYDGESLVVGTAAGDLNSFYSGIDVFVFERHGTEFVLAARLKTDTAPSDFRAFGQSVSIIGKRIAVGEMRGFRLTGGGRLLFYEPGATGER